MKKLFKPANITFYFLIFVTFCVVGILYAKIIEAGKDQMLAGGAIVLGYGVMFGGVAFLCSLFVAYRIDAKIIKRLNWGMLAILGVGYVVLRFNSDLPKGGEELKDYQPPSKPTAPAADAVGAIPASLLISGTDIEKTEKEPSQTLVEQDSQLNIGFFKPNFYEQPTLYFYGGVNLQKGLTEHIPVDSLVFVQDENENFTTSYAPPWLVPEHIKLDYGIIYFKIQSVGFDFVKVTSNKTNGREAYLNKNAGDMLFWPEFLLSINSVEFLPGMEQTVKIKPLDYAGEVTVGFEFLRPILIESEWMHVSLQDHDMKDVAKGWIRWKRGNKLLVSYSLFS